MGSSVATKWNTFIILPPAAQNGIGVMYHHQFMLAADFTIERNDLESMKTYGLPE